MLVNMRAFVRRKVLIDARRKMTSSFANEVSITACKENLKTTHQRSPLGTGSFIENKFRKYY